MNVSTEANGVKMNLSFEVSKAQEIHEVVTRRFHKRDWKVGVLVGFIENNKILVGWSKCNVKVGDKFDKAQGIELAKQRAMGLANFPKTPLCFVNKVRRFESRCLRYFKGAKAIQLV